MPNQVAELVSIAIGRGKLGRFRKLEYIGHGGFAIVVGAEDSLLERKVALKIPFNQNPSPHAVLHEARLLASLCHPNIVSIHSAECEACTATEYLWFFVTEFVAGGSLFEKLQTEKQLPCDLTVEILRQVAAGLGVAHEMGILHRDVKPDNILLHSRDFGADNLRVRLTDFGISVKLQDHQREIAGTAPYMAPECWRGLSLPQSDLYALGVSAYEMLTGQLPISTTPTDAWAKCHWRQQPIPVALLRPECTPLLSQLVERLLAKNYADRPKNALELVSQLEPLSHRKASPLSLKPLSTICSGPQISLSASGVLTVRADAIAYSANNRLEFSGGLAREIARAAGPALLEDSELCGAKRDGLPIGSVIVTPGYALAKRGAKRILHAATLYWNPFSRRYERQSVYRYLEDIAAAVQETCRVAGSTPDIQRLGLTLFGTGVRKSLYPGVPMKTLVAANIQGLHRHYLNQAADLTKQSDHTPQIVIAAQRRGERLGRTRAEIVDRQLRLFHTVLGDVTDANAEALIISANNWLRPGSGPARNAFDFGGVKVRNAIRGAQPRETPLARGTVVALPGGKLQDSLGNRLYLIHVVTTWYTHRSRPERNQLVPASTHDVYQATINAVMEAMRLGVRSIAMSLMCSRPGYHAIPQTIAPLQMAIASARAVNDLRTTIAAKIDRIYFCIPSRELFESIGPRISLDFGK